MPECFHEILFWNKLHPPDTCCSSRWHPPLYVFKRHFCLAYPASCHLQFPFTSSNNALIFRTSSGKPIRYIGAIWPDISVFGILNVTLSDTSTFIFYTSHILVLIFYQDELLHCLQSNCDTVLSIIHLSLFCRFVSHF